MPLVDDIIKVTIVTEQQGVSMSNALLYKVTNVGADPPVSEGLSDIVNAYWAAVTLLCVDTWKISCASYENLTSAEIRQTGFFNLAGPSATDSHPTNQVLQFNRWGDSEAVGDLIVRSRFRQSGIRENLSTRGRLNDLSAVTDLQNFLQSQLILTPNWTLLNMLYGTTTKPGVPPPPARVEKYQPTYVCRVSPTFYKLQSRRVTLCAP